MMTTLVATLFMVIKPDKNTPDTFAQNIAKVDEYSCFHSALANTIRFRYSGLARRVLGIRCLHALMGGNHLRLWQPPGYLCRRIVTTSQYSSLVGPVRFACLYPSTSRPDVYFTLK